MFSSAAQSPSWEATPVIIKPGGCLLKKKVDDSHFRSTVDLEVLSIRGRLEVDIPISLGLLDVVGKALYENLIRLLSVPTTLGMVSSREVRLCFQR